MSFDTFSITYLAKFLLLLNSVFQHKF